MERLKIVLSTNCQQCVVKPKHQKWVRREAAMAVKVDKYHLFRRRQDTGTFWYYWFEDEGGKRVQRACGHSCESKRDATLFLEELFRVDLLEEKRRTELRKKTFSVFADGSM
jgi:hypothetical protein